LNKPQQHQDKRTPDADRGVSRHQADRERGKSSQQQSDDQGVFAADPVAVVAEDRRTDWPGDEADKEDDVACSVPISGSDVGKYSLANTMPVTVLYRRKS